MPRVEFSPRAKASWLPFSLEVLVIPIKARPVVENGIAVYAPKLTNFKKYLLKLDIYYSLNNSRYFWLKCDNQENLLWSKRSVVDDTSVLFLYRRNTLLPAGFYRLVLTAFANGQELSGTKTIGVLNPTKAINIGLIYSIYPAIDLS